MDDKKIRLLLIEDDIVDQMSFERLIRKEFLNYDYEIVVSVKDALEHLAENDYDIVLTDYLLGDGTAFDIFGSIVDTPFIFMTGSGDEETAVKALQAGAFHYLIKDQSRHYLKILPTTIEKALLQKRTDQERQRAENELRKSEIKNRILLSSILSPVLALKDDMTIFYCNESFAGFVGKPFSKLEKKNILELIPDFKKTRNYTSILEVLNTGKIVETEEKFDDKYMNSIIYKTPWGVLTIFEDITTRKKSEEEIRNKNKELEIAYKKLDLLSRTDTLTELSNRRDMLEKIDYEMHRYGRSKSPFVLVLSDIDNFKSINDKHGHDAGDFILKEISKLLRAFVRKQDVVSRWGGEEFLMLLPKTLLEGGKNISEILRRKISAKEFKYKNIIIPVSMTFGVSIYDRIMDIDECIKHADQSLYYGKEHGKNRVVAIGEWEES